MDLANYQAMLNSSQGAAYGFASIAKRAGDALAPHLAKLLPKLYRSVEINLRMRRGKGIWQAVVDDPKTAVDSHFAAVMEELLGVCGSRQWRARQSAASALAELLSGRRFVEVEPYLERAWTVSLRVVDDIKETVREVGKTLCRSVRGLTVRLCDAHHSSPEETRKTIAATLPLLLQTGLLSPVKEIQSLSMDVVIYEATYNMLEEIRARIRPQRWSSACSRRSRPWRTRSSTTTSNTPRPWVSPPSDSNTHDSRTPRRVPWARPSTC